MNVGFLCGQEFAACVCLCEVTFARFVCVSKTPENKPDMKRMMKIIDKMRHVQLMSFYDTLTRS